MYISSINSIFVRQLKTAIWEYELRVKRYVQNVIQLHYILIMGLSTQWLVQPITNYLNNIIRIRHLMCGVMYKHKMILNEDVKKYIIANI